MTTSRQLGQQGEDAAAEYLERSGFTVVDRNWRCAEGEVDIVALDGDSGETVIVEVKTRRGHGAGHPFEAVTPAKVARLRSLALARVRQHPGEGRSLRIDAVGVTRWPDETVTIQHLVGIGS